MPVCSMQCANTSDKIIFSAYYTQSITTFFIFWYIPSLNPITLKDLISTGPNFLQV